MVSKKHLKAQDPASLRRRVGTRGEVNNSKIVFSLQYFDPTQPKKDLQTYATWQDDGRLADLMERLESVSKCSIKQAIQRGLIKRYHNFPPTGKTDFKCPSEFEDNPWFVIMKIGGQKARVAGVVVGNIFHIVFLDRNHRFWISKKKHT